MLLAHLVRPVTAAGKVSQASEETEVSLEQLDSKVTRDSRDRLGPLVSRVSRDSRDSLETADVQVQTEPLEHQVSTSSSVICGSGILAVDTAG